MTLFDAGVNLLDRRFDASEVIQRAFEAGVEKLCVITTHPDEWEPAYQLYLKFPQILCYAIGVHPHHAKDVTDQSLIQLEQLAQREGCVAIGECGLDFNRNFSAQDTQLSVFDAQLAIAVKLQKPVYLHERDAFEPQMGLLTHYIPQLPGGIAHCFTGTVEQVNAYLSLGLYIGITGWVCDEKRGDALREAVKNIPKDRLIFETDAPYLFPKTLRPRKRNNEPAFLPHIVREVSEMLALSEEQLSEYSFTNSCTLFSIG